MKTINIIAIAAVALMVATSGAVATGISGSAHDFTSASWSTNNVDNQLCVPCHTPHHAKSDKLIPLWNHESTAPGSWTMYDSPSLGATAKAASEPGTVSKACLSCHDGSIALNSYGGNASSGDTMSDFDSTKVVGASGDLSGDHPVGFDYTTAQTEDTVGLKVSSTAVAQLGASGTIADMLVGGTELECSSCHDIHEIKGESTTASYSLLVDNGGSDLCLACHNK